MKIALLGYGKMGKTIEKIAIERGHKIVLKIDASSDEYDITQADIAIEFSTPKSAFANISNALYKGIPVVAGTTGWLEKYQEAVAICEASDTAFLYASNFSIGVNIFFEINNILAKMMSSHPDSEKRAEAAKKRAIKDGLWKDPGEVTLPTSPIK